MIRINVDLFSTALSRAVPVDRDADWVRKLDELEDYAEEDMVKSADVTSIPSKLKAVIKFGYEDGMLAALGEDGTTFDDWIAEVFTHTRAHFRHAESLGTTIEFEVCNV